METAITWLMDITYMTELLPPACFRKKAGGISYLLIKGI